MLAVPEPAWGLAERPPGVAGSDRNRSPIRSDAPDVRLWYLMLRARKSFAICELSAT